VLAGIYYLKVVSQFITDNTVDPLTGIFGFLNYVMLNIIDQLISLTGKESMSQ